MENEEEEEKSFPDKQTIHRNDIMLHGCYL